MSGVVGATRGVKRKNKWIEDDERRKKENGWSEKNETEKEEIGDERGREKGGGEERQTEKKRSDRLLLSLLNPDLKLTFSIFKNKQ